MITRRHIQAGLLATLVAQPASAARRDAALSDLGARLAEIEARCGGRLGVGILDTATGAVTGHRLDERFPMCSTHKALSAAAILARVDAGLERLDRRVRFPPEAVLSYSPGTKPHAGPDGMALADICEAAVTLSDNTAANLMLDALDGPAGLTAWLRSIGDGVTRLDRTEPGLNEARPGDPRDTTSPAAMAATLGRLVVGATLSPASRTLLTAWLVDGRTGAARLRAGVPAGWRVGEKTGTNDHGTANDVGVLWPPGREPIVVTAFITQSVATLPVQDAAIADVARAAAGAVGPG